MSHAVFIDGKNITTIDWEGAIIVGSSDDATTVQKVMDREHEFPIEHPGEDKGSTSDWSTERRRIASEFEMLSVALKLPDILERGELLIVKDYDEVN